MKTFLLCCKLASCETDPVKRRALVEKYLNNRIAHKAH